ncbi:MAG TPA: TM2 domain-containing protein [Patescibacteria group bacterium]|nr:TM2 domain-containing protein [Patescibacteria group bacterium]
MHYKKNKLIAIILTLVFGAFGIHKFYLGRIRAGVLYLLFSWTFVPLLLALFDFIVLLTYSKQKFNKKYN